MEKLKKESLVGWTLKEELKSCKWKKGYDFNKTHKLPLLVSEPHYSSINEFIKIRITIEKIK